MFATDTSIWDTVEFGSSEAVEADLIREQLQAEEAEISRHRANQVALLREADRLQLDTADGSRTMADWVVSVLDVSPQVAHRLMLVASSDQTDIETEMTMGCYGLDRANFLCQLRALKAPEKIITDSLQYSLGHLFGLIERLRRITREDEQISFDDRYLVLQDSLDQSGGRFWGQTHGTDWESIKKALHHRESELPALPTQTRGQRMVDALASICLDSLTGTTGEETTDRAVVVAEVFVDAALAAASQGETGVTLSSGPRVGPNTLSELLCTGKIRVILQGEDRRPIGVSDLGEAIPPAVRAYVLHRDLSQCQADCLSRYRLQPHHIKPRAEGGDHDPDSLITLCWYHHHVAIHQMGMIIDPDSPPHHRRLTWPNNHGPPDRAPPQLNQSQSPPRSLRSTSNPSRSRSGQSSPRS